MSPAVRATVVDVLRFAGIELRTEPGPPVRQPSPLPTAGDVAVRLDEFDGTLDPAFDKFLGMSGGERRGPAVPWRRHWRSRAAWPDLERKTIQNKRGGRS